MSNSSNRTTLLIVGGLVLAGLIWTRVENGALEMKAVSLVDDRPAREPDSIRELPIEWERAATRRDEGEKERPVAPQPEGTLPQGWHGNPFAGKTENTEVSPETALLRALAEQKNSLASSGGAMIGYEARHENQSEGVTIATARRIPNQGLFADRSLDQRVSQVMREMPATNVIAQPTDRLLAKLQRGESLARRGATATAQQEFTEVLILIAQHNDAVRGETSSSLGLNRALKAIKEAEDFVAPKNGAAIDVAEQVLRHQTRVLDAQQAEGMTALGAAQIYYGYARKMFRETFHHDPVASRALFCLAKVHSFDLKPQSDTAAIHAKVMLLHYAALDCDPQNFPSANELGVMLAKGGRMAEARDCLAHGVNVQATVSGLVNLAKVQAQMGDVQGSQLTMTRAQALDEGQVPGIVNEELVMVDQRSFDAIPNRSGDVYVRQDIPQGTANPASDAATKNKRWFMWR
jgi:hypothetical protein